MKEQLLNAIHDYVSKHFYSFKSYWFQYETDVAIFTILYLRHCFTTLSTRQPTV